MRIAMIGSGYVGLVSGACLADFGHHVTCIDKVAERVDALKAGTIPIYEPDLDRLVAANVRAGRLEFGLDTAAAVADADIVFIGVGTPEGKSDGRPDLSSVFAAADEIARAIRGFMPVVIKSTVPVGTGDEVERRMRAANPSADVTLVSNPEFLREGAAIEDFKHPDRIVIGLEDNRARLLMEEVYRPLFLNKAPLMFTRRRTAELIKYASNAFLAMKISFINEIADLCEEVGADVQDVARGVGLDRRIGPKFLHAGPGFGGSCFPKDTVALARMGRDFGRPQQLVETTIRINQARGIAIADRIIAILGGSVLDRRIGLLGLAFKPNTDDVREAPAATIARRLRAAGAHIQAFDPEAMEAMAAVDPSLDYVSGPYAVADKADAVVIVTEWDSFRALDLKALRLRMAGQELIDLRNVYEPEAAEAAGLTYHGIGRARPAAVPLLEAAE
jgi:UDPglucose 6-dehydrogenase